MANKIPGKHQKSRTPRTAWLIIIVFAIGLVLTLIGRGLPSSREISWNEFEERLLSRQVVDHLIVVNKETVNVYLKKSLASDTAFSKELKSPFSREGINPGPHYSFSIGSIESFDRKMDEAQKDVPISQRVNVSYENRSEWYTILSWLLPLVFVFFFYRMMIQAREGGTGGSSIFNFGRSTARLLENDGKSKINFTNVAGLEEAKQEVKEIVDFLKDPDRYTKLGAKIPKGVIIVGPPGTGKTLLAKAVAGEAQVPFFSLSGSEFVEMFVGVGASRVRDLFKQAKAKAPCIVFIDEIDAVGRSRGKNAMFTGANDERESTLNQLLTEMDGFGTNSGVIVLAATNRADILDPALLRPGRFDRHIYLELPNHLERKQIFEVHLKPLVLSESVDTEFLASQTVGFSGADIANICNEAALIAARKSKSMVDKVDFTDAIDRIIAGIEKKSKIISKEERKIIAFHEAGHTVVSWLLEKVDPIVKVSIIPRGKSLGAAWYLPEERQIRTLSHFKQHITATLGGRAAEEIIFSEISSGAVDDLEKVTKEAYTMVAYFGLNKMIGNISFYDSTGRAETSLHKPYSEETACLIDTEVRALVEECYTNAKELLTAHKQELIQLAEMLLDREVIFEEDVLKILGARGSAPKPLAIATNV